MSTSPSIAFFATAPTFGVRAKPTTKGAKIAGYRQRSSVSSSYHGTNMHSRGKSVYQIFEFFQLDYLIPPFIGTITRHLIVSLEIANIILIAIFNYNLSFSSSKSSFIQ
jgi:hypothetical protein